MNGNNGDKKNLKDVILGGQDGLVNVLGIILGVAVATNNYIIVLIAGLSATFAESISMGAVAYTSSKAEIDYFHSINKTKFLKGRRTPLNSGFIVFVSAMIGSVIPLIPFAIIHAGIKISVNYASIIAVIISLLTLFITGALKAKWSVGSWKREGLEMVLIGLGAVIAGYIVGIILEYYFGVKIPDGIL